MAKAHKSRAPKQQYLSQNQLTIVGFETPFDRSLNPNNGWVVVARKIPWDLLVGTYQSQIGISQALERAISERLLPDWLVRLGGRDKYKTDESKR